MIGEDPCDDCAEDESYSRGDEHVSESDDGGKNSAGDEPDGAEDGASHASLSACAIHGENGEWGEHETESDVHEPERRFEEVDGGIEIEGACGERGCDEENGTAGADGCFWGFEFRGA